MTKNIKLEEWEDRLRQTPGYQALAEELEPAYQVTRLRLLRGLTQQQLAERIGTKQSSIARLESGRSQPSLSFLRRVIAALDGVLEVNIHEKRASTAHEVPVAGGAIARVAEPGVAYAVVRVDTRADESLVVTCQEKTAL